MANLYEINSAIDELLASDLQKDEEVVDNSTGEILSVEEALNQLELDQKTKFDNIACYIKNLTADAEALKQEEKKLADRRRVKENQAERLKNYLASGLIYAGYNKFETPRCALSFRTSKAVEIAEGVELSEEYLNVKITQEPNKKALKEAIELGKEIEGVSIVEKKNLQIK